ncbi:MAG TPA: cyclic nucleotide-binding domain-containing protein, partial [Pseudolabrys sp.]|nr:cyclic nucleotide-binding domain-containing protein [Pseudolabrys sp.]
FAGKKWEEGVSFGQDWIDGLGYLASGLVFATFCMKTMIPLRLIAMTSNIAFIAYGFAGHLYPVLFLHVILLPMNIWRFFEMIKLVRRVEAAATGDHSIEWLKPFMKSERLVAGTVLFRRDDSADKLYAVLSGRVDLDEIAVSVGPGQVIGEMGLFAGHRRRTQTARCATDVELLWVSEGELAQLCYQNPAIAFHLLRLITNRLLENADRPQPVGRPA